MGNTCITSPLNTATHNDLHAVLQWRTQPTWRKLPNVDGSGWDGCLPIGWQVKSCVVSLICCVRETLYDCRSVRHHVMHSENPAVRAHWLAQGLLFRADTVKFATEAVPNFTTLQYVMQTGVVQQHLAGAAAIQLAHGRKRIEMDFRHVSDSACIKVGATFRHVAVWWRSLWLQ